MDVIATTAFGLKLNCQKDKENPFVKKAQKIFDFSLFNPFLFVLREYKIPYLFELEHPLE